MSATSVRVTRIALASSVLLIATFATAPAGAMRPNLQAASTATWQSMNACPSATAAIRSAAPGIGRTVALTFDDGPGASTGRLLTLLDRHHVRATFFNLGLQLPTHARELRREVRLGEAIGNHTWDHADLTRLTAAAQAREIDRNTAETQKLVGLRPCLFRPPYGVYTAVTLQLAAERGLRTWLWSVDTEDWRAAGSAAAYWVKRIVSRARAGLAQMHPVVLMHNGQAGNPATMAALPRIIRAYRSAGYRFVRLH